MNGLRFARVVVASSLLLFADAASAQVAACTAAPDGPAGFTATAVSSTAVSLSWTAPPPPEGCDVTYTVYRSEFSGSLGEVVSFRGTSTSFQDTGLAPATTYYYLLEAVTSWGSSNYWPAAEATTLTADAVCSVIPATPTGLVATARSSSQIDLSWGGVASPPGCSRMYALFRERTSDFTPGWGNLAAHSLTETSFSDTGLAPGTTYYYSVQAYDSAGKSGDSPVASATTGQAPIVCTAAPPAVTVTATPISSTRVDVSWTASPPPPGCSVTYALHLSTRSDFSSPTQLASGLTSTSYSATGLAPSTRYYFLVRASDSAGSTDAPLASATTPGDVTCSVVPAAPAGLTATARSPRQIDLSWSAVSPPSGCPAVTYAVYQGTTDRFTPSDANRVANNLSSPGYSSVGLTGSTTYYFIVRAVDAAGASGDSSQASATTGADNTCTVAPPAPGGLTATAFSPSQINLSWGSVAPPSGCSALTYTVHQSTDPGFTPSEANRAASNLPSPSYSSTGLSPSTAYYFIVRAVDAAGASVASATASATTRAAEASCTVAPSAPVAVATSFSASQINLSWNAVSSPPGCAAVTYAVHQSTDPGFTPSDANRAAINVTSLGYSATGLSPSTTYYFVVRAFNTAGGSPGSARASATTQSAAAVCSTAPSAPSVTATPFSHGQINLSWNAVSPPPGCSAVSYAVYQSTDPGFTPSDANRAATNLTSPGYSSTGLSPSTTYYFVVRASDAAGSSDSSKASAATRADPALCSAVPPAPTGLVAVARSATDIDLSWSAVTPPSGCSVSYAVYQGTSAGFTPSDANRVVTGLSSPAYTATRLSPSTTYYFIVRALDAAGASADSASGAAKTEAEVVSPADLGGCSAAGTAGNGAGILLALAALAVRARARRVRGG